MQHQPCVSASSLSNFDMLGANAKGDHARSQITHERPAHDTRQREWLLGIERGRDEAILNLADKGLDDARRALAAALDSGQIID